MIRRALLLSALAALTLSGAACRGAEAGEPPGEAHEGSHPKAPPYARGALEGPPPEGPEPAFLRTVPTVPVEGRTGPGGTPFEVAQRTGDRPVPIGRRIGTRSFHLTLRSEGPDLGQYPCTSCHIAPARLAPDRVEDAHMNLEAVHPSTAEGRCSTCHAPDVQRLRLQSGEMVTIDHAYRLCAQCHFAQVDAWAGGAHGKRLDGWRGRRVVMQCAECHDPHAPTLERRIPFRAPFLPRAGQRNP
jgi:hypothetical protein